MCRLLDAHLHNSSTIHAGIGFAEERKQLIAACHGDHDKESFGSADVILRIGSALFGTPFYDSSEIAVK